MKNRIEKDYFGEVEIPADMNWGIHTARAVSNFKISGRKTPLCLVRAIAMVKKAACLANRELGYLDEKKAAAMIQAADEVIENPQTQDFPVDGLQGGAGTSTNMNVNEVLANRALCVLGLEKGDYAEIHPIEDVNKHQSTNDVYPTAVKVAAIFLLRKLNAAIAALQGAFQNKEKEFQGVIKIGRTEYQDAVPMTLGAEFSAFAEAVSRDRWRTFKCEERLRVTNLGGTAIGTGLSAPRDYIFLVIEKLREITGLGLSRAENLPGDTAFAESFVEVSGILKAHACNLIKIAGDLRQMNMLGEIRLPQMQTGSSIMPGKVNPVILEAVIQVAIEAKASDVLIAECLSWGSFQINEFLPMVALHLLESLEQLTRASEILAKHVAGIQASAGHCRSFLDKSPMIITAFLPHIGYEKAHALLKEFEAAGEEDLRHFLNQKLGESLVSQVLSPENLTRLGYDESQYA